MDSLRPPLDYISVDYIIDLFYLDSSESRKAEEPLSLQFETSKL